MQDPPDSLTQAETRSRILRSTGADDAPLDSKWLYYERPVRDYLRRLGCGSGLLDDLAQEALIHLAQRVIPRYDPGRGAFRPYLKQALRNLLRDRLRALGREREARAILRHQTSAREAARPAEDEEEGAIAWLEARAREMFARFCNEEAPEHQRNAQILEKWVVDRLPQTEIAALFGLKSSRQVRTLVRRAAARFAVWMEERLHPDDRVALLGETPGLLGLFSHLSARKRLTVLALLERIAGQDADADG